MEELWQKLHVVKDMLYQLNYNIEKIHYNLPTRLNFFNINVITLAVITE
jgi:hypothetical protein